MAKDKYRHTPDEIDDLLLALGKVLNEQGVSAFKDALPSGLWPLVDRMMDIRKVGHILATEIVLRAALKCEGLQ